MKDLWFFKNDLIYVKIFVFCRYMKDYMRTSITPHKKEISIFLEELLLIWRFFNFHRYKYFLGRMS
jgi:hypothetical protein